jgi:hypothetical protein
MDSKRYGNSIFFFENPPDYINGCYDINIGKVTKATVPTVDLEHIISQVKPKHSLSLCTILEKVVSPIETYARKAGGAYGQYLNLLADKTSNITLDSCTIRNNKVIFVFNITTSFGNAKTIVDSIFLEKALVEFNKQFKFTHHSYYMMKHLNFMLIMNN